MPGNFFNLSCFLSMTVHALCENLLPLVSQLIYFCCYWSCFYRHVLASLHFNENLQRQTKKSDKGEDYLKVTYPKFKLGEEVVREVPVSPTYGEPLCIF